MPTTLLNLKNAILSHMNRASASFNQNSTDAVLRAINNAKDYAQRTLDFEYAREFAQLPNVSLLDGANLSGLQIYNTATSVDCKSLERAYFRLTDGSGTIPVKMFSREQWAARQQRRYQHITSLVNPQEVEPFNASEFGIVQYGRVVYPVPADQNVFGAATTTIYFDIIKWLPDFVNDNEESFLLTYCFDFMLFRSIFELNFFLKEDARVPLSKVLLDDIWNNIVNWNATIVGNSVDTTLD
jgi:hypothetical protein